MPNMYKVQHEDSAGNLILYASSADIVAFDSSGCTNLDADDTQEAISTINQKAEGKAKMLTFDSVIQASAFEGVTAPYTQSIDITGILGTDRPDIGARLSSDIKLALAQQEAFGSVTKIETGNGNITVFCYEDKPTVDIPIQIRVFR